MFGLPVSRGVAIGRAVLVASSRVDVAHYFIDDEDVPTDTRLIAASHRDVGGMTATGALIAAFALAPLLAGRNLLRMLLGDQIQLPDPVWRTLNHAWAGFFALLGIANLYVAFHYSTETWVNFKLFGTLGLTLAFVVAQAGSVIAIAADGVVTATVPGNVAPQPIGTIALASFVNPAGLDPRGQNLFAETAASGQPNTGSPGLNGLGQLMQGFVETSNVNVVQELVTMIQTQRAYELNSKAVQTSDQMLQKLGQL